MAKTVSVIGCGWLGLPLAERLIERGFTVKGSTTREERLSELRLKQIDSAVLDLRTTPFQTVPKNLVDCDILVITIPFKRTLEDPYFYLDQIRHLLNAAVQAGVTQIIFSSSTAVYPKDDATHNENSRIDAGDRAQALAAVERLLLDTVTCQTTILRFGGLFGPGREPGRFFSKKATITGGDTPVNLIHLDDCLGIIEALIDRGVPNTVYNAVSPDHPSRKDFYSKEAAKGDYALPAFIAPHDGEFKLVCSQKLQDELNYTFKVPL